MASLAVVVPTLSRPDALASCLDALGAQHRAPDELVVVTRLGDPGIDVARGRGATVLTEDSPGVLAAMAAGVRATTSDVVAFTDDDAVAPRDWTARLLELIERSDRVGGAGGRDHVVHADGTEESPDGDVAVGRTTWYGRHHGGHHLGRGAVRDVEFLKGVNCAYRRAALGLPLGLRGRGAQVHFEVAVGRHARALGYRLVYDPSLVVEHHPAERQGEDQRGAPSRAATKDAAYNLVVAIGGVRGLARVPYAVVLGDRGAPGVLRAAMARAAGDHATARKLGASVRGTLAGGAALVSRRGLTYETFCDGA